VANPQPTDAHLRIAHQISEQLMVSHFTEQQRRILDLILRLSWGCGKKEATIPHQNNFEIVGVLEGHIKTHLDWLQEAKVIFRDGNTYSFNKNFDQWRVSRALAYTPSKLTELVRLNLNGSQQNLPNREETPYRIGKKHLTEKGSPSDTNSDTPKERLKKVLKKDTTSSRETLDDYIITLRERFKDIDFDTELEKFWIYWKEGDRKLKIPKLALINWMTKAREHKKEAGNGTTRRNPRSIPGPGDYTKPENA